MRAWPLHVVFSTILLGSLAGKERAVDVLHADDATLQTAVTRIAQSQGLDFREYVTVGHLLPAVAFEAPGCSRPVLVIANVLFDEEPLMRFAREQGDDVRFVYIDRSWEKPDRLAFLVEKMKYAALAVFGLTRIRAIRSPASGRLATALRNRRCHRLAKCLEPRLYQRHPGRYRDDDPVEA